MNRLCIPTVFLVATLAALGPARAQPPAHDAASPGVVLLTSGQVLQGIVTVEGEQALVTLGPGSQLRLPRTQIVCAGRTLDEVFKFQHRLLSPDDVTGRVELVRWCLRTELPAAAGRVMVELVRLAPDDPRVAYLEQQLRQQVRKPAEAIAVAPEKIIPPADELKSVTQQLSPQAFDIYMRHIQPLLLNHCSASGCHGVASKSQFQLLRPLTGKKLTQRMMQRNLHTVLGQIDRAAPLDSPILAAAAEPHATFDVPLVSAQTDRRELEMLKAWLQAVGKTKAVEQSPETSTTPDQAAPQPISRTTLASPNADSARPPTRRASLAPAPQERSAAHNADDFNRAYFPERFQQSDAPSP